MPKDDVPNHLTATAVDPRIGTTAYPPEFRALCDGRRKRALGDVFGLSQFGVNHTILDPGAASAQRHWHTREDEFVYVISGTITLIDDDGETALEAGDCAGFPAGRENGHMLVNKSDSPAIYLEVGARHAEDEVAYPDIDLHGRKTDGTYRFTRKDGSPAD